MRQARAQVWGRRAEAAEPPTPEGAAQEERTKKRKRALAEVDVKTHADAILAGAIGAALLGAYRTEQLARRGVNVAALAASP